MNVYLIGVLSLLGSILVSCINDVLAKYVGANIPAVEIVFSRFFCSFLISLIHLRCIRKNYSFIFEISGRNVFRGILGAISFYLYTYSIINIKLVTVTTIMWSVPLFVIFLSRVLLREHIAKKNIIATVIGFLGVGIAMFDDISLQADFKIICIVPLVAALLFALQDVIIKQVTESNNDFVMIMHFSFVVCLLTAVPAVMQWVKLSISEILILFLIGFFNNAMQYLLFVAYKKCALSLLAPIKYVEFIFQLSFGYLFFHEIPENSVLLSVMIILLTTYINTKGEINIEKK